jgi:hypothetical protein
VFVEASTSRNPDAPAVLFDEDAEFLNVTGLWWHDCTAIHKAHAHGSSTSCRIWRRSSHARCERSFDGVTEYGHMAGARDVFTIVDNVKGNADHAGLDCAYSLVSRASTFRLVVNERAGFSVREPVPDGNGRELLTIADVATLQKVRSEDGVYQRATGTLPFGMPNKRVGVDGGIDAHHIRKAWPNTDVPSGGLDDIEHPLGDLAIPLQEEALEVETVHRRAGVQKIGMVTCHNVEFVPERIQCCP